MSAQDFCAPGREPALSRRFFVADGHTMAGYRRDDGYGGLAAALKLPPAEVIDRVKKSALRGRGGAGFPTGMKWSFIPADSKAAKYMVVNADESEPGTYKDRYALARDPHALIEGAAIGAYAIGAHDIYVYIRGEFGLSYHRLVGAVAEAYEAGILGGSSMGSGHRIDLVVHRGAGAYICGEETALLESLEGRVGKPRLKPPFPAAVGAFGGPTIINNVETLTSVALIFQRGHEWFAAQGSDKNGGPKLICISGHVGQPGIYEVPNGYPCDQFIQLAGGVWKNRALKAVIPGGSSTPILKPQPCKALAAPDAPPEAWPLETQVPLDFDSLRKVDSMFGSAGMMVLDETTCLVRSLKTLANFYAHESCGQCTPCREGTGWAAKILGRLESGTGQPRDLELLKATADNMGGLTICPLADALAMPIHSYLKKFGDEFASHLGGGACPFPDYEAAPTGDPTWEDGRAWRT